MSKIILTDIDYQTKQLGVSEISDLIRLQENAFLNMSDDRLLRRNSKEILLDCLKNHFVLGVIVKEKIIAFGILYFGKMSSENIGFDLDLKGEEILQVANIKLIIVDHDYQGNHLQKHLILKLESEAKMRGYSLLACTISPDNIYSVRNFLDSGFKFFKEKQKYSGLIRNIYYKNI